MLRRVGFSREFYPGHPSLPSLREQRSTRRTRSEARIVAYLRGGHMLAAIMEGMTDVLDGTPFDEGSGCSSLLTDGVWVWRRDLAHYVERYHVPLPDEFVRHLVEAGFEVPDLSPQALDALAAADEQALGVDWWADPGARFEGSAPGTTRS